MDEQNSTAEETKAPSWWKRNRETIVVWGVTAVAAVGTGFAVYALQKKQAYSIGHSYGEGLGDAMTQKALEYKALKDELS